MIGLQFDVDGIRDIQDALKATDKQVWNSIGRALNRTAATLRKQSLKEFRSEIGMRTVALVRRRLRDMKLKSASFQGFRLWYGLNNVPISYLKGTIRKSRKGGASKNSKIGSFSYPKGFVVPAGKGTKYRSVYERVGRERFPIKEEDAPIKDRMDIVIEDRIFNKAAEIFWHHFESDLRRQVKYSFIGERYEAASRI